MEEVSGEEGVAVDLDGEGAWESEVSVCGWVVNA